MSNTYIAYVNDAETAPLTYSEMHNFTVAKKLPASTPVRESNSPDWMTWADIQAARREIIDAVNRTKRVVIPPQIALRDSLRNKTAYPFLRLLANILIGLCVAASGIAWIGAFMNFSVTPVWFAVAITLGIPFALFWTWVALALIDIADKTISQE